MLNDQAPASMSVMESNFSFILIDLKKSLDLGSK
jgi:hypothetical protein